MGRMTMFLTYAYKNVSILLLYEKVYTAGMEKIPFFPSLLFISLSIFALYTLKNGANKLYSLKPPPTCITFQRKSHLKHFNKSNLSAERTMSKTFPQKYCVCSSEF